MFITCQAAFACSEGKEPSATPTSPPSIDSPRYSNAQVSSAATTAGVLCTTPWRYKGDGFWTCVYAGNKIRTFDERTGRFLGR